MRVIRASDIIRETGEQYTVMRWLISKKLDPLKVHTLYKLGPWSIVRSYRRPLRTKIRWRVKMIRNEWPAIRRGWPL